MEVKGKVIQMLPMQSGMGKKGPWKKQEFILETQSQYPKKVCLSVWGDKVDQFGIKEGELLSVSVELESREYNGRWYTEARAWKIDKTAGARNSGSGDFPPPSEEPFVADNSASDDLPF